MHILIISKPLFPYIFPNKTSKSHSRGEFTKYPSASSDTKKKTPSLSCSAPMARFIRDNFSRQDNEKSEAFNRASELSVSTNIHKKRPDSTSAQNIDSPNFTNIETCPKSLNYRYAQSLDKPPMCGTPDLGLKF